jgi:hypothetical protein
VSDDLLTAITGALSAQGTALVIAGGKSALRSLYQLIRERFGPATPEARSLDVAVRDPDEANRRALADALSRIMAEDPQFARRVRSLWDAMTVEPTAGRDAVTNTFTGQADQVLQAHNIAGDVTFGR